jgi:hypothetical protein
VWAMAVLDNTKANPEAEIVTMAPDMQT